jgi:hypothetical protein
MGTVLLIGGLTGAAIGVVIFNYLKAQGQVDLLVKLCYVVFLGVIGSLMFVESLKRTAQIAQERPSFYNATSAWLDTRRFRLKHAFEHLDCISQSFPL